MAIGALIGAYQEDDSEGLRALLPLAGRTLLEYQVRCAAAAGAAPIVVVVERDSASAAGCVRAASPGRYRRLPVSDVAEAVSRFEAGSSILLIGDGVAPPVDVAVTLVSEAEPTVATVPDDEVHERFERIDAESRWAGVAVVDAHLLGSTAAMLGDWDLQSTLLRRSIQEGARRVPVTQVGTEPLLVESAAELADFQRFLFKARAAGVTIWRAATSSRRSRTLPPSS